MIRIRSFEEKSKEALATYKRRYPFRQEIIYALAACIFPIQVWSIFNMLKEVPAWILRLSIWDLIGVIAYTQAFALLESLIVLFLLLLLSTVLPWQLFRENFLALSTVVVFFTSTWFILAHFNAETVRLWGARQFIPWILVYLFTIGIAYLLVQHFKRLEEIINSFVQRLSLLSFVYIFIDILSVFIVIIRNI